MPLSDAIVDHERNKREIRKYVKHLDTECKKSTGPLNKYSFPEKNLYKYKDLEEFKQEDILYLYRLGFLINQEDDGFLRF